MKKNINLKLSAYFLVAVLALSVAVFGSVKAFESYNTPKVVVEGNYIEAGTASLGGEQTLGAATSPYFESLDMSVNGDRTYHIVSGLSQSTSTLVSIANPYGVTTNAIVESVLFVITTAATSSPTATTTVTCGAAASATVAPSIALMTSDAFAASTTVFVANGVANAQGAAVGGGSVHKIALSSTYPYFTCVASNTSIYGSSGVVGKATVRISQTR